MRHQVKQFRVPWPFIGVLGLLTLTAQGQTRHTLGTGREAAVIGTGMALHGFGLSRHHMDRHRPLPLLHPDHVPRFDRVAMRLWSPRADRGSDILFGVAAAASFATAIANQHGERPLLPAVILLESGFVSAGLTNTVKELVRRPRPYLYNAAVPAAAYHADEDDLAFWSGHTANTAALTFACASMVQRSDASRGLKTATWIGAALAPAVMGYLRVRAGQHFPSDVAAGYLIGAAVGIAVPYVHRRDSVAPRKGASSMGT